MSRSSSPTAERSRAPSGSVPAGGRHSLSSPHGRWLVTCTLWREGQGTSVEQPCTLVPQHLWAGVGGAPGLRAVSLREASPGSEPSGCVGFLRSSAPLSPAAVPLPAWTPPCQCFPEAPAVPFIHPAPSPQPLACAFASLAHSLPPRCVCRCHLQRAQSGCPSESRLGVPAGVCLAPPFLLGSADFLAVLPHTRALVCQRVPAVLSGRGWNRAESGPGGAGFGAPSARHHPAKGLRSDHSLQVQRDACDEIRCCEF